MARVGERQCRSKDTLEARVSGWSDLNCPADLRLGIARMDAIENTTPLCIPCRGAGPTGF